MDTIMDLPVEEFTQVTQELLNNLYKPSQFSITNIDAHIVKAAKEDIRNLIASNDYDISKAADSLRSKGWDQDKLSIFLAELENSKSELLYTTLIYHNSKHGETVTDFDWILKLVLGTNELKTFNYPLLQLLLSTINSKAEQKHTVYDVLGALIFYGTEFNQIIIGTGGHIVFHKPVYLSEADEQDIISA